MSPSITYWSALECLIPSTIWQKQYGFSEGSYVPYVLYFTSCACFDLLSAGNLLCVQNIKLFNRDDKSVYVNLLGERSENEPKLIWKNLKSVSS